MTRVGTAGHYRKRNAFHYYHILARGREEDRVLMWCIPCADRNLEALIHEYGHVSWSKRLVRYGLLRGKSGIMCDSCSRDMLECSREG